MNKQEALQLVNDWVPNKNLVKHMLAVGVACKAYAKKFGEDEELWEITGILHDVDWQQYPEEHPGKIIEELKNHDEDEKIINAIARHMRAAERPEKLDKVLFACDELTGLVVATALMYPGKLADVTPERVLKKMKDKGFAKGVDRDDIILGAKDLGVELNDHIATVIKAMRGIKEELGL